MKPSATKTAAAVVVIVTALSYAPSIGKPFLWDDFPFIVTPSADRALTDIPSYFAQDQHLLYRPLRATAYTIAHALFGLHPLPYRVIAIGLHLALTLLFLSILRSIGLSPAAQIVGAALFGLHPAHADRVANTAAAFDLVGLAFGYAALRALLRDAEVRRGQAVLFLILGLLGSEECVTIPLLYVGWLWVDGGTKATATQKKRLAAAFGVTIAYLLLRTVVLGQVERAEGIAPPALETRLLTMSTVIWHEAAKLVFPFALRPAYWVAPRTAVDAAAVLGFAGIAAILVWILARRSTGRPAVFGVLWFFVALLPFSNVIALDTFMAERYLYSALGGVAIVVAASLDATSVLDPAHPRRRRLAAAIFGVIFFSMAAFTAHRAHVWSNETRLWRDAFRKDNKALLVLVNLANEIKLHEIGEDPCPYFERAQIYNTDAFEIFPGLGECAVRRGDLEGATVYFKKSLESHRSRKGGLEGLSQVYVMRNLFADAARAALELRSTDPNSLVSHYVLGYIHLRQGHIDQAREELSAAASSGRLPHSMSDRARELLAVLEERSAP